MERATDKRKGATFAEAIAVAIGALALLPLLPFGTEWMLWPDTDRLPAIAAWLIGVLLSAAPAVAIGAGSYKLYLRKQQAIESDMLVSAAWWGSVLCSGAVAGLVALGIARTCPGLEIGHPSAHWAASAATGIAFGAGWGQGEKLM